MRAVEYGGDQVLTIIAPLSSSTTYLCYDLPDHDDNFYSVQRNKPRHASHEASIGVLQLSGDHVRDEGNEDKQQDNDSNDSECDTASDIIRALGTDESETCGIPLAAYGANWVKWDTVVEAQKIIQIPLETDVMQSQPSGL